MPSTSKAKPNLVAIKDVRSCYYLACQITVAYNSSTIVLPLAATIWAGEIANGAHVRRRRSHPSSEGSTILPPDFRWRLYDFCGDYLSTSIGTASTDHIVYASGDI